MGDVEEGVVLPDVVLPEEGEDVAGVGEAVRLRGGGGRGAGVWCV